MATDPLSPKKEAVPEESDSDAYDANRFTVTRMPTEFLRWMMKHPLPKANRDELWKDTLPPGMEMNREQLRDDEPAIVEKSKDGVFQVKPLTPKRDSSVRGENRRAWLWIVGGIVLCSVVALGLALRTQESVPAPESEEAEEVPQAETEEPVKSAGPVIDAADPSESQQQPEAEEKADSAQVHQTKKIPSNGSATTTASRHSTASAPSKVTEAVKATSPTSEPKDSSPPQPQIEKKKPAFFEME